MKRVLVAVAAALAIAGASAAERSRFVDVLDSPAQASAPATRGIMQAVARAGERLVAVGQRGQVLWSDDHGTTWKQAKVPVSSDLTAVYFVDAKHGWVVGHDGVVLHSDDAGEGWRVQLDGRKANELLVAAMARKADAEPSAEAPKKLLAEAQRYAEQGPDKPFLDVWFSDASNGFVVGAYNLVFRTGDGGATWEPWFDRTDNPKFFNLYAIRPADGQLYVAGEGGLLLKLDPAAQRFRAMDVAYTGSFFGVTQAGKSVLAFGLRGNAFRSDDGGRTWVKVETGLGASVVAAARVSSDALLLADASGRLSASADGGRTFANVAVKRAMPIAGLVEAAPGKVALAGPRGMAIAEVAR